MKKIFILFILLVLFLIPCNGYSIDMPGITSNEVVSKKNNNLLNNLKDSLINYEEDDVMKYSLIIFISLSFIIIFIIYKKQKIGFISK